MAIFKKKRIKGKMVYMKEGYGEEEEFTYPWQEEEIVYNSLTNKEELKKLINHERIYRSKEKIPTKELAMAIVEDSINYNNDSLFEIYKLIGFSDVETVLDELSDELDKLSKKINKKNVVSRAKWLLKNGTRITIVKLSLFLIGKYTKEYDLLSVFGRCEVFSLLVVKIFSKENMNLKIKDIFAHLKGNIKKDLRGYLKIESDYDRLWLIEKTVDSKITDEDLILWYIENGYVAENLLLNSVTDEYINGVTELFYIFKDKPKNLYKVKNGGAILNHYVKHIISRLIDSKALQVKYVIILNFIRNFINDKENLDYLAQNGFPDKDINIVSSFIEKAIKYPGWKKVVLRELRKKKIKSYDYIVEAIEIINYDCWEELYSIAKVINFLDCSIMVYLIKNDKNNRQEELLDIILKNVDIVNVKFPKKKDGKIISPECIVIEAFMEKYSEESNNYLNLISIATYSNLPNIIIRSYKLLEKWDIAWDKYLSKEKIEEALKDSSISEKYKEELEEIQKKLLQNK